MMIWKKKKNLKILAVHQRFQFIYKTMLSCCKKMKVKNTESENPKVAKTKKEEYCSHQNEQCAIIRNRDLSRSKKLVDY